MHTATRNVRFWVSPQPVDATQALNLIWDGGANATSLSREMLWPSVISNHMKPGLRGRYWVQSPNSRVDSSTMGKAMRIPCSIARRSGAVLVPGMNADTCEEPLSAAKLSAVAKAGPMASDIDGFKELVATAQGLARIR